MVNYAAKTVCVRERVSVYKRNMLLNFFECLCIFLKDAFTISQRHLKT